MNYKSKINTSKGKTYLTVVALATVLMMSLNLNANMNANMNAYASIFSDIQNVDDVGQSLECVVIVVGCDAVGSVGSSGDVIVDSGDNDTNGGNEPEPTECELCLQEALTDEQIIQLGIELGLGSDATLLEICAAIEAIVAIDAQVLGAILTEDEGLDLSTEAAVDLLECLGIAV